MPIQIPPRGMRLKNPLNIRQSSIRWLGGIYTNPPADPAFVEFTDVINGIRAACKIILNYHFHDGVETLAQIVSRWAPSTDDNDTGAYIADVASRTDFGADDKFDFSSHDGLCKLVAAMARHEQGGEFLSSQDIATGVSEALAGYQPPQA